MVIGLANLVFGGIGSDPEDIIVLRFLHHWQWPKLRREGKRRKKERKKNEWKRREGVTSKCRLYSSDAQYCNSREVLFRGRKQFFKRIVSQWQCLSHHHHFSLGIQWKGGDWLLELYVGLFFRTSACCFFSVPPLLGFQDLVNTLYQNWKWKINLFCFRFQLKVGSSFLCIGVSDTFFCIIWTWRL